MLVVIILLQYIKEGKQITIKNNNNENLITILITVEKKLVYE